MIIIKATYGGKDCTEQVQQKVKSGSLLLNVNNDIIGDPAVGRVKSLLIDYAFEDGLPLHASFTEGSTVRLQRDSKKKLGIFYSNNNNPKTRQTILASMTTIAQSAKDKADIISCFWVDEPNSPFNRLKSWYAVPSHLTQLLQIMQLLYTAKQSGSYDYVSFLEHDVLYPDGYFDFPDFPKGTVICNMNYGGLSKEGWQPRNADHQPFHQMTMRFDDAIKHCESILPNALVTNSGMIESQTLQRGSWRCKNEAIHVNHGHHFTSHFTIYGKANSKTHPYWGESENFLHLFDQNG